MQSIVGITMNNLSQTGIDKIDFEFTSFMEEQFQLEIEHVRLFHEPRWQRIEQIIATNKFYRSDSIDGAFRAK